MTESPNKKRIERLRRFNYDKWQAAYSPILKGSIISPERSDMFLRYHHTFRAIDRIAQLRNSNQLTRADQDFEDKIIGMLEGDKSQ